MECDEVGQLPSNSVHITSDEKVEPESFVVTEAVSIPEPAKTTASIPARKQRNNVAKERQKLAKEREKVVKAQEKRHNKRARNPDRYEENIAQLPDYSEISQRLNQELSDTNLNDIDVESSDEIQRNVTEILDTEAELNSGTSSNNVSSNDIGYGQESNTGDVETQNLHILDASVSCDTSQAVDRSTTNADETESEIDEMREPDFYFAKLRAIERLCKEAKQAGGQLSNTDVQRILYDEEFSNTNLNDIDVESSDEIQRNVTEILDTEAELNYGTSSNNVSSIDIGNGQESNTGDVETQNLHILDTSMAGDTSPAVDRSTTNIDEIESETAIDNVDELGSISRFDIDSEANTSDAQAHNLHFLYTSMPSDTNQTVHSTIAESGTNIGGKRHKCAHCSYVSKYNSHLLSHSLTHTGEKPYKCNQCSFASTQAVHLKRHIRIHTGEKPYKCDRCSFACAQSGSLTSHMRIHTGDKPYKCNKCSFACAAAYGMKTHMITHTGEKPYKCSQCSYASATTGQLITHILTHSGKMPFKCNQCSYACAQLGNLKTHMRRHSGEKPYKCTKCSYASARAGRLKTHILTHSGEMPFKCSQCSYTCAIASNLKRHLRSHNGEKPYKCSHCSFASVESSSLTSHMRIHTGEKPYKCDQCSFACTQAVNLKTHMRTHTGEKPYKCNQCSYGCAQLSNLKNHMRTHI